MICHKNNGFVALVSTIIVVSISSLIILTINFSVFNLRYNVLDIEYKKMSYFLTWGCFERIVLGILKGEAFAEEDKIFINNYFCAIKKINFNNDILDLDLTSEIGEATTNLQVKFDNKYQKIIFWSEF